MATPRVVILGCGFGGLWAAQALRKAPVELTVVDRTNHHLFTPLLYQVATAGLAAPEISGPIRHILAGQRNVTVLMGEARSVDVAGRAVVLEDGSELPYDKLIVATGSINNYFGNDQWAPFAPALKPLDGAPGRDRLARPARHRGRCRRHNAGARPHRREDRPLGGGSGQLAARARARCAARAQRAGESRAGSLRARSAGSFRRRRSRRRGRSSRHRAGGEADGAPCRPQRPRST